MSKPEIYVSTDIEADGPIPGPHSMLSFASVALLADGTVVGRFSANLELLKGATGHPATMSWWASNKPAFAATRKGTQAPEMAMKSYVAWLKSLPGKPVFVGYPASYDQMWIHYYNILFTGEDPLSFSGIDIKTYAMCLLNADYKGSTKKNMPKSWFPKLPHTHVAADDAMEQGLLFINMLKARKLM